MKNNRKLARFIFSLLAFATSMAIAQQNPNGNTNGKVPPFAIMRSTFITTGAGIGLGHRPPKPDTTENGIIVDPHLDASAPFIWGFRGSGQQGNGVHDVAANAAPARVNGLPPVAYLSGGAYHLLALTMEGEVWGWGQSGYGETGCRLGGYQLTPCKVQFSGDPKIIYVDAGEYVSMALTEDGDVYTWGHNLYGQLGNGGSTNTHSPQKVNLNGEKAVVIGAAYEGGFAVTDKKHVWAWGDNEGSGLGFQGSPYGVQRIVRTPTHVTNLDEYAENIIYIAGGNGWGQALLRDGTVIGWGLHASLGQGTTATHISSPVPVVVTTNIDHMHARYVGTTALTRDGKIVTWGQTGGSAFPMIYGASPTIRTTVANDKVVAVGGTKEGVFYRTESGRLFGVGYNDLYKLNQSTCCGPNIDWPGAEIITNP